jgi:transglutaminase-like putative cysteine protease
VALRNRHDRTRHTTAEEALEKQAVGVCQDHAHIFCSAARFLGLPARYVSGYLLMDDRTEQTASHAWAEAACCRGSAGSASMPPTRSAPTNAMPASSTGLDYDDAAPVSGIRLGNSAETLAVAITVEQ